MINLKNTKGIIFSFIVVATIFFLYSDQIVDYVDGMHPVMILLISTLLSPVYLVFIWMMYKDWGIKGAFFSFLFVSLSDCISLPHFIAKTGEYSTASFNLLTDTLFYSFIPSFLKTTLITLPIIGQVKLAVFLLYVIIPITILTISLMVLHKRKFKQLFLKSI